MATPCDPCPRRWPEWLRELAAEVPADEAQEQEDNRQQDEDE